MTDLQAQIERIARVPVLLVASDYDGTMAPIVADPGAARPHREAVVAMRMLAELSQTHVAVISGRALADLSRLCGMPDAVHLVGSHGSEFDVDFATSLSAAARGLHEQVSQELEAIAAARRGMAIERKPASVALHYRNASEDQAEAALQAVLNGPATIAGVHTKHGKKVVELSVVETNKGAALAAMRQRLGASAVIFFGDDVTDEDAFAQLSGPDVAVKIGPGETIAPFRVNGPEDVARLLARLGEARQAWLANAGAVPIEQHSMLSDQRTIALVTPAANVTWLCLPRIDSPAIFADLLGGPTAGYFSVCAADGSTPVGQAYIDGTMTVETRWATFTVTDFLDCSDGRPTQRPGRTDLLRIISGTGRVRIEFAPRLDFGRLSTCLTIRDDGIAVDDTLDPIVLRGGGVQWTLRDEGEHQTAVGEVELSAGAPVVLELRHGTGSLRSASTPAAQRRERTDDRWRTWAALLRLPRCERALVERSALLLKGLCFGPTGAIAAAATTSLPEHIGGVRNWDYRYCWLRDGAMAAASLARLGTIAEAMHFLDWVLEVVEACESPERLQPLYGVSGGDLGPEGEIGELAGYRGSRPVRVGNYASRQIQLDVFGPVVQLVALLCEMDAPLSSNHWWLVENMVEAVAKRWREPDHGIWEIRAARRHHVHSKIMCWYTVDRAIAISGHLLDRDQPQWRHLRDEIADDVLTRGYSQTAEAFTIAYGEDQLDAAALLVGLTGMIAADDQRFGNTVSAIEDALMDGPVVYRYHSDDGLPGGEGGFLLCTAWMIEAYIMQGRLPEARALFDRYAAMAGHTGLMSEEYDPQTGTALGNVPQAYSHIGLIDTALQLDAAGG